MTLKRTMIFLDPRTTGHSSNGRLRKVAKRDIGSAWQRLFAEQ